MSVDNGPICFICRSHCADCGHREPELVKHFAGQYSLVERRVTPEDPKPLWWPPKQRSTSKRGRKGASY